MRFFLICIALLSFSLLSPLSAAEVTWKQVEPVIQAKCIKCHAGLFALGGLKLNNLKNALKGGKSGKVIVPGNAADSIMVQQFYLPSEDIKHMPPAAELQLTEAEITLIRQWIDAGAR